MAHDDEGQDRLVGQAEVDRLQDDFDQATDVMERLRLADALVRAENPSTGRDLTRDW